MQGGTTSAVVGGRGDLGGGAPPKPAPVGAEGGPRGAGGAAAGMDGTPHPATDGAIRRAVRPPSRSAEQAARAVAGGPRDLGGATPPAGPGAGPVEPGGGVAGMDVPPTCTPARANRRSTSGRRGSTPARAGGGGATNPAPPGR
eukprot:2949798-Pleurochrysis_carterae.AAC.1